MSRAVIDDSVFEELREKCKRLHTRNLRLQAAAARALTLLPQGSTLEDILSHASPQIMRLLDRDGQCHSMLGADAVWARSVEQLRARGGPSSGAGASSPRGDGVRLEVEQLCGCKILVELLGYQALALHRVLEGSTREDAEQIRAALASDSVVRSYTPMPSTDATVDLGWSSGPSADDVRRADDLLRRWDEVRDQEKALQWQDCKSVTSQPSVEKLTNHRDHPSAAACPLQSDERTQLFTTTIDASTADRPSTVLRWQEAHEPNHGSRTTSATAAVAPEGLRRAMYRACKTSTAADEMVRQVFAAQDADGNSAVLRGAVRTSAIAPQLLSDVALQAAESTSRSTSLDPALAKAVSSALPPPRVRHLMAEHKSGRSSGVATMRLPDLHFHLLMSDERRRATAAPTMLDPKASEEPRPEQRLIQTGAIREAIHRGQRVWTAMCTDQDSDSDSDSGSDSDSDHDDGEGEDEGEEEEEDGGKEVKAGKGAQTHETIGLVSGTRTQGTRAAMVRAQIMQILTMVVGAFYPYAQAARHELQEAMALDLDDEIEE